MTTSIHHRDPVQKAHARAQALVVACDIQPVGNLRVLGKIATDYNGDKAAWSKYWIEKGFTALEEMVAKTAGKYSVGDQVTVADVCLVPQVYNAFRWGVDMTKFPTLQRVNQALSELPAFQKAHADNQVDAVKQ
jgi:maleylacetoacetate isomerase